MAECDRSIGRGAFAQGGEDGNCGQLALLPRQQVAFEDVAEQVLLQVLLDDGSKGGISRLGSILRRTAQLFEQLRATGVLVAAVADGRCVTSHEVGDALRLALVQYLHEGLQGAKAAGKAAIGIGVYQYFFHLVHRHAVVQPTGEGCLEVFQIACGSVGGNGYDALLAGAQRVCLLRPEVSTHGEQQESQG